MLDRIHKIAEIVAAIAIVTSLIFVGLQLRQNTSTMQASIIQSNATNWQDILLTIASNDALMEAWEGSIPPDRRLPTDMARRIFMITTILRSVEFDFLQWQDDNFSDERWQSARRGLLNTILIQPEIEIHWNNGVKNSFTPGFQDMMQEALVEAKRGALLQPVVPAPTP